MPNNLALFIVNNGFLKMNYYSVSNAAKRVQNKDRRYTGLCLETFRHNFTNMMRIQGVPGDVVNVHQGRNATVQDKNYCTEDSMFAVNLMRPYMEIFERKRLKKVL